MELHETTVVNLLHSFVTVFDSGDRLPRDTIIDGIKLLVDNYNSVWPLPYDVVRADYSHYMDNPYSEGDTELCCDSDSSITTDSNSLNVNGLSSHSFDEFSHDNRPEIDVSTSAQPTPSETK